MFPSERSLGVPEQNRAADQAVCKRAGVPSLPSECDTYNYTLQSTSEKTDATSPPGMGFSNLHLRICLLILERKGEKH